MSNVLSLNVFGDSYSTSGYCVEVQDSFWWAMAKDIGASNIRNYSHPGFSLDHIIHILLNEQFDWSKDYFCIGIPPLVRYAVYDDRQPKRWPVKKHDVVSGTEHAAEICCLENIDYHNFQWLDDRPEALDKFSTEWHEVQSLEKIFLLVEYLRSKSCKFVVLNLTKPIHYQEQWPAGGKIMKKVADMTECVVFNNTYYSVNFEDKIRPVDYDRYSWNGHHGAAGNKNWYTKVVKNKITELGWLNNA